MATCGKGYVFTANETVTNTKLHSLVDSGTVTNIVNDDIDASAAIADSKLAQITTAGKVSGTALTGLASIPSGAGVIPDANVNVPKLTGTIQVVIDGAGGTITTGKKVQLEIPFACTLNQYTMVADAAGAIVIDVNRSTYANFPTTASICGGGKECTISATNQKSQDTAITDWTSDDIAAGDILEFEVDSCTTITRCTLSIKFTRT